MGTDRRLIIIGVVVGVGIGTLVWRRCSHLEPVVKVPTNAPANHARNAVDASLGMQGTDAAVEGPVGAERTAPILDAPDDAPIAITTMKLGLDDAHAHVRDLIAPCFEKLAKPKLLKVRYRLIVVNGRAEISEPSIIGADLDLGSARDCIVKALDNADWSAALPDLETPIEDELVNEL